MDYERSLFQNFLKGLRDLPYPSLRERFRSTREQRAGLSRATSWLLSRFLDVAQDAVRAGEPNTGSRLIVDSQLRAEVDCLKSLMIYYVYKHPALSAQQHGHRRVIRTLFETLNRNEPQEENDLLPFSFREDAEEISTKYEGSAFNRERARLASDVIVSMTEAQALQLYARITGLTPGTVRDAIV